MRGYYLTSTRTGHHCCRIDKVRPTTSPLRGHQGQFWDLSQPSTPGSPVLHPTYGDPKGRKTTLGGHVGPCRASGCMGICWYIPRSASFQGAIPAMHKPAPETATNRQPYQELLFISTPGTRTPLLHVDEARNPRMEVGGPISCQPNESLAMASFCAN